VVKIEVEEFVSQMKGAAGKGAGAGMVGVGREIGV
jgi:hypothetical protein